MLRTYNLLPTIMKNLHWHNSYIFWQMSWRKICKPDVTKTRYVSYLSFFQVFPGYLSQAQSIPSTWCPLGGTTAGVRIGDITWDDEFPVLWSQVDFWTNNLVQSQICCLLINGGKCSLEREDLEEKRDNNILHLDDSVAFRMLKHHNKTFWGRMK